MRETGIGTSLILIAAGAVLAFGITVRSTAINIEAIGAILIVVGLIGLLLSFVTMGDWLGWGGRRRSDYYANDVHTTTTDATMPHEHRRVETTDVVYEDEHGPRVERERRIHR